MPDLDPVTQDFVADVTRFVAGLVKADKAAEKFAAECLDAAEAVDLLQQSIDDLDTGKLTAGLAAAAAAAGRDAEAARTAAAGTQDLSDATAQTSATADTAASVLDDLRNSLLGVTVATAADDGATADLRATFAEAASSAEFFGAAADRVVASEAAVAVAAGQATGALREQSRAAAGAGGARLFRMFGYAGITATALHWLVAGSAELLAVGVPALVAFGAGMATAAQGAMNLERHMVAVYDATEATYSVFHKTTGDVIGLGHALQAAQNAANPGVYELMGSAVNDLRARSAGLAQVGLQVVHMWDEFAARVTVDMKGALGRELQGLLSSMVTDLREFGQVLGNAGHALLNFASAMPGLAHVLLAFADGVSRAFLWLSRLPAGLITAGMAAEEFVRWGGLLITTMVRLAGAGGALNALGATNFFTRFGAGLITLVAMGSRALTWAGEMIGRLTALGPVAESAGGALAAAGEKVALLAGSLSPGMVAGIAVAAAGLGYLIYRLATAKDATEKWVAANNKAVQAADALHVLPAIYTRLALTSTRLAGAQNTLAHTTREVTQVNLHTGAVMGRAVSPAYQQATQTVHELTAGQRQLIGTAATVGQNIGYLSQKFHVSAAAAVMLAQDAGVKLQQGLLKTGQAGAIATQQIDNLLTGMGAMQAPAGELGNDMQVLGVSSSLAATKVQQLTQAWQQYLGLVTGGMGAFSQFMVSMHTMASDTAAASASLHGSFGSISTGAAKVKFTMHGLSMSAMQSMQQFQQALTGPAEQFATWIQNANAMGVGIGKLGPAVRALTAIMLPYTQGNKAAVSELSAFAQMAGVKATDSAKVLAREIGHVHHPAQLLDKIMTKITGQMSHLSKVAQNLSAVVGQQMDQAFASAIMKATGLGQAYQKYANDIANGAPRQKLVSDLQNIAAKQREASQMVRDGTRALNTDAQSSIRAGRDAQHATGQVLRLARAINRLHSKTIDITAIVRSNGRIPSLTGGGGHQAIKGAAGGATSAPPGPMIVGEHGPELLQMAGGEHITPAGETSSLLASLASAAAAGSHGNGEMTLHITLQMPPASEQWAAMQTHTLRVNRRNAGNMLTLPVR